MTFLPIVERELRVRSRQKSTYRFRQGGALIAILLVSFMMLASETFSSPGQIGQSIFLMLAWPAFAYCLLEGTRNTADCLSEEKRSGTLGLLFLTDLKGYDVVLGKLMATSLNSFYGLLGIFPPLAIPIMIGGVTAGEFWRLVLVLVNTLFFSLTAGICFSAASWHERKAWGATLAFIGVLTLAPLVGWAWPGLSGSRLLLVSPSTTFGALFDASYASAPDQYWNSLLVVQLLSWCFLIAASVLLPRLWQDLPHHAADSSFWRRHLRMPAAEPAQRQRARRRLLSVNPVLWLADRQRGEHFYLWLFVGIGAAAALLSWSLTKGDPQTGLVIFICAFGLHFALAVWAASRACHFFAEALSSGALELLLSTPLNVKVILDGYAQALKRMFFGPVIVLVAVEVFLLLGQTYVLAVSGAEFLLGLLILVAGSLSVLIFVLDLYAVSYFGMWMGVSSKKPGQATPPAGRRAACGFLWPVLGVVKNLIFISYAQDQLRRRFRLVVTERFAAVPEITNRADASSAKKTGQLPPVYPR